MAIVTADIHYQPQQEIVRDILIMQVASKTPKKSFKSGKNSSMTKEEQDIREYLIKQCETIYLQTVSQYQLGSSAQKWAAEEAQQNIINYLLSLNHPVADKLLKEYRSQWKKART